MIAIFCLNCAARKNQDWSGLQTKFGHKNTKRDMGHDEQKENVSIDKLQGGYQKQRLGVVLEHRKVK